MTLPSIALSIQQPWAWLIIHGGKDIENRDWPTNFRGPVLIHAGKKIHRDALEDAMLGGWRIPEGEMHLGGIVGVVDIVGCVTKSDSIWFQGRYGFVLENARPLAFTPCRGQLKFFDPGIDVRALERPEHA